MKTIELIVDVHGQITVTTKGFTGTSCRDASKFLNALGQVVSDKPTAEYHLREVKQQKQRS